MSTNPPRPHRRLPAALHLIWTVPLALGGTYVACDLASFYRCGITACTTPDQGGSGGVALLAGVAGLILAAPVWFVPWTRRTLLRVWVGGVVAVATTIAIFLYVTSL